MVDKGNDSRTIQPAELAITITARTLHQAVKNRLRKLSGVPLALRRGAVLWAQEERQ